MNKIIRKNTDSITTIFIKKIKVKIFKGIKKKGKGIVKIGASNILFIKKFITFINILFLYILIIISLNWDVSFLIKKRRRAVLRRKKKRRKK